MNHQHRSMGLELLNDIDAPDIACRSCGSPHVELPDWTDPNRREITGDMDSTPRDGICGTCSAFGELFWVGALTEEEADGELVERIGSHAPEWRALIARNRWGRLYRPDARPEEIAVDPPA